MAFLPDDAMSSDDVSSRSSDYEEDSVDEELAGLSASDASEPDDSDDEDYDDNEDIDALKDENIQLKQEVAYLRKSLKEAQSAQLRSLEDGTA